MIVTLDRMMKELPPRRRAKIAARKREILAEERTLRDLRRVRALTQLDLARRLGIKQDGISRIEQRSDLLLSTLRRYVAAMGGELELVARFPDRAPVALSGLNELRPSGDKRKRRRRDA